MQTLSHAAAQPIPTPPAAGATRPDRDRTPALDVRSLSVFVDLGVPDPQIAKYFGVSKRRVVSLRRYYGLS